MSTDETLRQWKDPEFRSGTFEHPAGDIDLTGAGSNAAEPLTVPTPITVPIYTYALSCFNCDETFGGGTCHLFTSGCCGGAIP